MSLLDDFLPPRDRTEMVQMHYKEWKGKLTENLLDYVEHRLILHDATAEPASYSTNDELCEESETINTKDTLRDADSLEEKHTERDLTTENTASTAATAAQDKLYPSSQQLETQTETQQPYPSKKQKCDNSNTIIFSDNTSVVHVQTTSLSVRSLEQLNLHTRECTLELLKVTHRFRERLTFKRFASDHLQHSVPASLNPMELHVPWGDYRYDGPVALAYKRVYELECYQLPLEETPLLQRANNLQGRGPPPRLQLFLYDEYAKSISKILKNKQGKDVALCIALENIPARCIFPPRATSAPYTTPNNHVIAIGNVSGLRHWAGGPVIRFDTPGVTIRIGILGRSILEPKIREFAIQCDDSGEVTCGTSSDGPLSQRWTDWNQKRSTLAPVHNIQAPSTTAAMTSAPVDTHMITSKEAVVTEMEEENVAKPLQIAIDGSPPNGLTLEQAMTANDRDTPTDHPDNVDLVETQCAFDADRFTSGTQHTTLNTEMAKSCRVKKRTNTTQFESEYIEDDQHHVVDGASAHSEQDGHASTSLQVKSIYGAVILPGDPLFGMNADSIPIQSENVDADPLHSSVEYVTIKDLVHAFLQHRALSLVPNDPRTVQCIVNLYGVVTGFSAPSQTKRGDWMMNISLIDDSLTLSEDEEIVESIYINIFSKSKSGLPAIEHTGDVLRMHRVELKQWSGEMQLTGLGYKSSYVSFRGDVETPEQTKKFIVKSTAKNSYKYVARDHARFVELWVWGRRRLYSHPTVKKSITFKIADMHSQRYSLPPNGDVQGDLVAMVTAIVPFPDNQRTSYTPCGFLRVWDGTGFPNSDNPIIPEVASYIRAGEPSRQTLERLADLIHRVNQVTGCQDMAPPKSVTGRCVNVVVWESEHWALANRTISVGSFVRFRNVPEKIYEPTNTQCLMVFIKSSMIPLPSMTNEVIRMLINHNDRLSRNEPFNPSSGLLPIDYRMATLATNCGYQEQRRSGTDNVSQLNINVVNKAVESNALNVSNVSQSTTDIRVPKSCSSLQEFELSSVGSTFEGRVHIVDTLPSLAVIRALGTRKICCVKENGSCRFVFGLRVADEMHFVDAVVSDEAACILLDVKSLNASNIPSEDVVEKVECGDDVFYHTGLLAPDDDLSQELGALCTGGPLPRKIAGESRFYILNRMILVLLFSLLSTLAAAFQQQLPVTTCGPQKLFGDGSPMFDSFLRKEIDFCVMHNGLAKEVCLALAHDATILQNIGFGASAGVAVGDAQSLRKGVHQIWLQAPPSRSPMNLIIGYPDGRKQLYCFTESLRPILEQTFGPLPANEIEISYLIYGSEGASYGPHVDVIQLSKRERVLSFLLYLGDPSNDADWDLRRDGGALRIHEGTGSCTDVAPNPGTMVIFDSATVLHEVMPTYRPRTAIAGWFGRTRDASNNSS